MAKLGSLWVSLGLNSAEFDKNLSKSSRKVRRAGRRMRKSFQRVDKAMLRTTKLVVGLAGPAALGLLVKSSFDTIDALAKTADKLGITTDKLAGLQHAANITGVAQETLNKALTKQQKAIFDADKGLVTYKQHFDTLGLSTKNLIKLSPDEQFKAIGEALNKVENQTLKTAIAYDIFGGRGTALLNTLALGADGLSKMQKEAEALGLAVSRVDAAKIEETNDAFQRVKGVVAGVGNKIAIQLAPMLSSVADMFTKAAIESEGFKNEVTSGVRVAVKGLGMIADGLRILEIGWKTINVVFQGFIALAVTGMAKLGEGVAAVANALGAKTNVKPEFLEFAEAAQGVLAETTAELALLTSQPMPSENIQAWSLEVETAAQKAGEAVAAALSGGATGDTESPSTIAMRENLAKQVEAMRQSTLSEEEILLEKYERQLEMLTAAEEAKVQSIIPFQELREKMEEKHQKKLGKIREDRAKLDKKILVTNITDGMFITGQLLAAAASLNESRNKKEFERSKKLQTASIIINTASAAMKAYNSASNPWVGAALAAVVIAAGAVQLNRVSSASYSGGGSVGGAPAAPASGGGNAQPLADTGGQQATQTVQQQQPTKIIVNIDGKPIIDTIQQASRDGSITIDANSVRAA